MTLKICNFLNSPQKCHVINAPRVGCSWWKFLTLQKNKSIFPLFLLELWAETFTSITLKVDKITQSCGENTWAFKPAFLRHSVSKWKSCLTAHQSPQTSKLIISTFVSYNFVTEVTICGTAGCISIATTPYLGHLHGKKPLSQEIYVQSRQLFQSSCSQIFDGKHNLGQSFKIIKKKGISAITITQSNLVWY